MTRGVPARIAAFRRVVWDHYHRHRRDMAWRDNTDPYWILVSEVMLQQTQVSRVARLFPPFIERFPTVESLAASDVGQVIAAWQGLGYNRRAKYLHSAAGTVVRDYQGCIPEEPELLVQLPGIGVNTAGSISAFAYNRAVVFVETNIRRAVLHQFFPGERGVTDGQIRSLVADSLERERPREWYWALMDYGAHLATRVENPNRRSRAYQKQAPFRDSNREARGAIVRVLADRGQIAADKLPGVTRLGADRIDFALDSLERDGMITRDGAGNVLLGE